MPACVFAHPEVAVVKSNVLRLASSGTNAPPASGDTAAVPGGEGSAEFPGAFQLPPEVRQRILDRYDKNGDGKLDESERAAMQEARRRRMAEGGGGVAGAVDSRGGGRAVVVVGQGVAAGVAFADFDLHPPVADRLSHPDQSRGGSERG